VVPCGLRPAVRGTHRGDELLARSCEIGDVEDAQLHPALFPIDDAVGIELRQIDTDGEKVSRVEGMDVAREAGDLELT
jgi:hypothetical protein